MLALAPRGDIVGLSHRADDANSHLRAAAGGLPQRRAGLEPVLASRAQLVVRYWGGDPMLTRALERRGVKVVTIDDAHGLRRRPRQRPQGGRRAGAPAARRGAWSRGMDAQARRAPPGAGRGGRALYLTPGGFTAGPGHPDRRHARRRGPRQPGAPAGFAPVPLERLALSPPTALVLGFFDAAALATQRWALRPPPPACGRSAAERTLASPAGERARLPGLVRRRRLAAARPGGARPSGLGPEPGPGARPARRARRLGLLLGESAADAPPRSPRPSPTPPPAPGEILWTIRAPRAAAAAVVGAALGLSGAVMQGLLRNPLADPGVLGVSAGAGLGAALAIAAGLGVAARRGRGRGPARRAWRPAPWSPASPRASASPRR